MTIAQELNAALEKLEAAGKNEAGLLEALTTAKARCVELEAKATQDLAQLKGELEAIKLQANTDKAMHEKVVAEIVTLKAELDDAKAKLALAPFKDVVNGRKPLVESGEAGSELDVIALVDAATGAEKMRLYQQHKAAYDRQFAERASRK